MVMFDNSPRVTIDRILADAADDRRRGTNTSDVDALRGALTEAIGEANEAHGALAKIEEVKDEKIAELEAESNCGLSDVDRKAGKSCDADDCLSCRLIWAALEKDCGAADDLRTQDLCASSRLGIDRCCECAAHLLAIETRNVTDDLHAEIARLTSERDAMTPGKSADVISALRSDLAIARARHDCGREDRESGTPCPNDDPKYGACDACILAGAARRFSQEADAKIAAATESMRHACEGLRNALQIVTRERDEAIVSAGSRPVARAKTKPVKAHEGPSLFDVLTPAAAPKPTKAPRAKGAGRNVKKYPPAKVSS